MQKGRALLVSGRLQSRSWEQDGQKRSKLEVVIEDFNFVGGNGRSDSGGSRSEKPAETKSSAKKSDDEEVVIEDIDDEPVDLSDIPF